jgi:hypothetical protein
MDMYILYCLPMLLCHFVSLDFHFFCYISYLLALGALV